MLPRDLSTLTRKCFQLQPSDCRNPCGPQGIGWNRQTPPTARGACGVGTNVCSFLLGDLQRRTQAPVGRVVRQRVWRGWEAKKAFSHPNCWEPEVGTRAGCGSPSQGSSLLWVNSSPWPGAGPPGQPGMEAQTGSSTPPTSTCYSGLSKGAHLGRCEEQQQSHRKKWSPAADHPGSEGQLLSPPAGRPPFPVGRKVQKWGQTLQKFQGSFRNWQALGPSKPLCAICAHATHRRHSDPGRGLPSSIAPWSLEGSSQGAQPFQPF